MDCERCLRGKEAQYRAYSDIIDMKVCGVCAAEGRRLGLSIEVFDPLLFALAPVSVPERCLPHLID